MFAFSVLCDRRFYPDKMKYVVVAGRYRTFQDVINVTLSMRICQSNMTETCIVIQLVKWTMRVGWLGKLHAWVQIWCPHSMGHVPNNEQRTTKQAFNTLGALCTVAVKSLSLYAATPSKSISPDSSSQRFTCCFLENPLLSWKVRQSTEDLRNEYKFTQ